MRKKLILTQEAERLQKLIDVQPTADNINNYYTEIRNQLERISFDRAAPAFIQKYDSMNLENGAQNIS